MSDLPDSPLSPTARTGSRLPVLRKPSSANGSSLRQPTSSSSETSNSSRILPAPKTRTPTGNPSNPSIAKRGTAASSSAGVGSGSSSKSAEPRGSGLRKVPSKQAFLPSTAEDSASDTSNTSRSTVTGSVASKDPLKALKDQRRSSAVYVPAANIQKKPSNSQLSTPSVNRRASASQLPTLSSLNKKVSAASLNKKPSNSSLSASASTVSRKPSSSNLQTSHVPNTKASSSQSDRKASTTALGVPNGTSQPSTSQPRKLSSGAPKAPSTPTASQRSPTKVPPRPAAAVSNAKKSVSRPPTAASEEASPKKAQSLKDAIAQARAARNAMLRKGSTGTLGSNEGGIEFNEDPFNTGIIGSAEKALQKKVQLARTEGRLNIANLELKEIPTQVYSMYEISPDNDDTSGNDGPKWYEAVDLVKLIAADNDIVEVGEELAQMFGGLMALDMHNNMINILPKNLINLTQLTSLNLTNNKLDNDAFELICGITSLLELKIARNSLEGDLTSSISQLYKLEILELYENKITSVPNSMESLSNLKTLNISHNALERFPFEKFRDSSLNELVISHNSLKGTLFGSGDVQFTALQSLDFRSNRISALCDGNLRLPGLKSFFGSNNELSSIPDMSEWTELFTFSVDYNRLDQLPQGLTELTKLRVIDFTGNNLVTLDPALGTMEALEVLKIEGNPLRERLLFNMSTVELKRTLKGRLAPPEAAPVVDKLTGNIISEEQSVEVLELGPGGVLDLSKRNAEDISRELLESVNPSPIAIEAHHNLFVVLPQSFEMFTASLTTLNLSHSRLSGEDYLPKKISLRWLSTLTLSNNSITSIQPIMKNLDAPKLEQLDIAANRVKDITGLRPTFPLLTRLYARDNVIEEIPVDTVDGMRILDLSGNSIATLPPKLGLVVSLRELRVEGNCFRVPRWQILEKGTEAVLTWLRDKLPPDDTTTEDGFVSALEE